MARTTTASAIRGVLEEALGSGDVVLVGESVGRGGGVAGTSAGLLERFGADVVIDVPVADRAAVAFATGLAIGGKTVVVELSAAGRLPAVSEALAEAASIANAGEFAVPLIVCVPYGTEAGDRIDRPVGDLLGVPGLIVACGSDPDAVVGLFRTALASGKPVVLLEPRALYSEIAGAGPTQGSAPTVRKGTSATATGSSGAATHGGARGTGSNGAGTSGGARGTGTNGANGGDTAVTAPDRSVGADPRVGPGPATAFRARVVRDGDHVTLAAWGTGVGVAIEAADVLANEGISAEVIDLMTLSPIDRETLGASVSKTGRIVVVHPDDEATADRVLRVGTDEAFWSLESPPARARHDVASVAGAARDGVFT